MSNQEDSEQQARAQLETIKQMVERLEHAKTCTGDDECELPDEALREWGCGLEDGTEREVYHDFMDAERSVWEDPISVEVRSDWYPVGYVPPIEPREYSIVLCTGGPFVRIVGKLNNYVEPATARLQHQDWFTPWGDLVTTDDDNAALLAYARCFSYERGE